MEITIIVLIGVIIYQAIDRQLDKREAVKRERELLNRLMARDYAQYVQAKITEKAYDKETPVEEQPEIGIPM